MFNNGNWSPESFHGYKKINPADKKKRIKLYACHSCKGTGIINKTEYHGFKSKETKKECINCNGSGRKERSVSVKTKDYYEIMELDRNYAGMKYKGKKLSSSKICNKKPA